MGTRFRGWPEQAYPVLLLLGGEPSRQTRERVRHHREEHVRQPMIDLLSDLADTDPWYEDFAVWRYAGTAYWWQNQCAVIRVARNIEVGLRFSLDGLRIKAAWWYAGPEQIALFRAATAADETGRTLADLVSSLAADGHQITGDVMKRVPRGYPADHPRAGRRAGIPRLPAAAPAARLARRARGRRAAGSEGRSGPAVSALETQSARAPGGRVPDTKDPRDSRDLDAPRAADR